MQNGLKKKEINLQQAIIIFKFEILSILGDALAEIETDKAAVTFEATEDGILAKILVSKLLINLFSRFLASAAPNQHIWETFSQFNVTNLYACNLIITIQQRYSS